MRLDAPALTRLGAPHRLQCSSLTQWCTPTEARAASALRSLLLDARLTHLACSQVYEKCTYEPKGTWFRGTLFIVRLLALCAVRCSAAQSADNAALARSLSQNAPNSWPCAPPLLLRAPPRHVTHALASHQRRYCRENLEQVYNACDFVTKQADSCDITAIAAKLDVNIGSARGNSHEATAALQSWQTAQRQG
jgi:hypothetical protein